MPREWRPLTDYSNKAHGDLVMLKLKAGDVVLGCFYDCEWMRDDPGSEDVADAFWNETTGDSNHIELEDIESWRPATKAELRAADFV